MAGHWWGTGSSWPSHGTMSRRRHSDTHLLANPIHRIKKLELSRQHSLPDSDNKQLDQIFESVTMNTDQEDDIWLQDRAAHSKIVHQREACCPHSIDDNTQARHPDKKGLYSRRSSHNLGMFDRACKTLFSSDPDIHAAQAHLGYPDMLAGRLTMHDLRADLEHPHDESGFDQCTNAPSKMMNIFSTILLDSYSQARQTKRGQRLLRKHSIDSHMLCKKKQHSSRLTENNESKRAIKICRPDHVNTMYISAVDSLGGLPDDEDGQHVRRLHFLPRSSALYLELDPHGALSRRSSCPVIFEGEESDESSDVTQKPYLSSSLDRDRHLVALPPRDDVFSSDNTTSSSEDTSYCQSPQISDKAEKFGHFFVGSDPFEGSDEADQGKNWQPLENVPYTANKRSAVEKRHKSPLLPLADNSMGCSMSTRVVQELNESDQQVSRKQAKCTTADSKSRKQPVTEGDAPVVRVTNSEPKGNNSIDNLATRDTHSNNMDSKDLARPATRIENYLKIKPLSDESGSCTSESHPSSATSSADESTS